MKWYLLAAVTIGGLYAIREPADPPEWTRECRGEPSCVRRHTLALRKLWGDLPTEALKLDTSKQHHEIRH